MHICNILETYVITGCSNMEIFEMHSPVTNPYKGTILQSNYLYVDALVEELERIIINAYISAWRRHKLRQKGKNLLCISCWSKGPIYCTVFMDTESACMRSTSIDQIKRRRSTSQSFQTSSCMQNYKFFLLSIYFEGSRVCFQCHANA